MSPRIHSGVWGLRKPPGGAARKGRFCATEAPVQHLRERSGVLFFLLLYIPLIVVVVVQLWLSDSVGLGRTHTLPWPASTAFLQRCLDDCTRGSRASTATTTTLRSRTTLRDSPTERITRGACVSALRLSVALTADPSRIAPSSQTWIMKARPCSSLWRRSTSSRGGEEEALILPPFPYYKMEAMLKSSVAKPTRFFTALASEVRRADRTWLMATTITLFAARSPPLMRRTLLIPDPIATACKLEAWAELAREAIRKLVENYNKWRDSDSDMMHLDPEVGASPRVPLAPHGSHSSASHPTYLSTHVALLPADRSSSASFALLHAPRSER